MKKIIVVLLALCLILITGCSEQKVEPTKTDEKVVKEVVVVIGEDGTVYVPNEDLAGADEVVYKLEDGTEVNIVTDSDLSVSGEYSAELTYVKEGETVTQSVLVLSDTKEHIDEVVSSTLEVDTYATSESGFNWYVDIDGVVYGPDEIAHTDLETSIKWLEKVYGDKLSYFIGEVETDGVFRNAAIVNSSTYDSDCENMRMLISIVKKGGYITVKGSDSLYNACGF